MYQSDNKGIGKEAEYSSLRAEILNSIVAVDNYKVAMYATTAAIWAVAFPLENPILFLLPYIALFAFQQSIGAKNENMILMAAYIAVYLEEGTGWENENGKLINIMRHDSSYRPPKKIVRYFLGRISSVQLGMLCSALSVIYSVAEIIAVGITVESVIPFICILFSTILYIIIRIQTKDVLELSDRREEYISNLRAHKEKIQVKESEPVSV